MDRLDDALAERFRIVADELLAVGLLVNESTGAVTIDTRTDKHKPLQCAFLGTMNTDATIYWVHPEINSKKQLDGSEIVACTWVSRRDAAAITTKNGRTMYYHPGTPQDPVECVLPSYMEKINTLETVDLKDLLPALYGDNARKAVCKNILSSQICIDPSLIYDIDDFGDDPTENQKMLIKRISDADAARVDGRIPIDLMMPWTDEAADKFKLKISQRVRDMFGKRVTPAASSELVRCLAADNPRNPFIEQIPPWDGNPRVKDFAKNAGLYSPDLSEDELTLYITAWFDTWLYMAGRRALHGGTEQKLCPVIIGEQGIGKTSLVIILGLGNPELKCHNAFSSSTACKMEDRKKFRESFGRSTIMLELAEAKTLTSSDVEDAKSFLDAASDDYRNSYGHDSTEHIRYFSMIATTNNANVLKDDDENRRFIPLWQDPDRMIWKLNKDDFPEHDWMLQFWAEIIQSVKTGIRYDMTAEYAAANDFPVDDDGHVILDYLIPESTRHVANVARSSALDVDPFARWLADYLNLYYPNVGDFVPTSTLYDAYNAQDLVGIGRKAFEQMLPKHIGLKWKSTKSNGNWGYKRLKPFKQEQQE